MTTHLVYNNGGLLAYREGWYGFFQIYLDLKKIEIFEKIWHFWVGYIIVASTAGIVAVHWPS